MRLLEDVKGLDDCFYSYLTWLNVRQKEGAITVLYGSGTCNNLEHI